MATTCGGGTQLPRRLMCLSALMSSLFVPGRGFSEASDPCATSCPRSLSVTINYIPCDEILAQAPFFPASGRQPCANLPNQVASANADEQGAASKTFQAILNFWFTISTTGLERRFSFLFPLVLLYPLLFFMHNWVPSSHAQIGASKFLLFGESKVVL
jgi:hypothetical protein